MDILIIQTGGTIDKAYPRNTKAYAFEISTPAVTRIFNRLKPGFTYQVLELMQKDSLDLNDADRASILKTCLLHSTCRIIITHGTDSMLETALFLQDKTDKIILITGAALPERFKDSDASFNIGVAIGAIQTLSAPGVYIGMNGLIIPARFARRNLETGQFYHINY